MTKFYFCVHTHSHASIIIGKSLFLIFYSAKDSNDATKDKFKIMLQTFVNLYR